jgi:aspartate racemase
MHVGLIVGIGPAATDIYYRFVIAAMAARGVDLELTMTHADTPTLLRNQASGNVEAQVAIYRRLTDRLEAAGARAVAVTSIAGHFCIDAFKAVSPLPVIDMLVEVDREIGHRGLRRVGVIGTRIAMETGLYGAVRRAEVVAPPEELLGLVHDAYVSMAIAGTVTEAHREVFFRAGRTLVDELGAEAVLLGGTDLGLAFNGRDPGFATLDCAAVHATAIVAAAAQEARDGPLAG